MYCYDDVKYVIHLFFFFSSRRRHTRSTRDWSSDVCSSDLPRLRSAGEASSSPSRLGRLIGYGWRRQARVRRVQAAWRSYERASRQWRRGISRHALRILVAGRRSEERRGGKEWRSRGTAEQQ